MKLIKINTPDGQYTLPLIKVAEHRAGYYEKDKESSGYKAEVEWVLNDNYEAIDWLLNNTDYEDWEYETTKLNSDVKVTMNGFWCSSDDFEIVEM
jgi:hypothetical protein